MRGKHHLDRVYYSEDLNYWRPGPQQIYGMHLDSVLEKLALELGDSYYDFRFLYYDHRLRRDMKCIGMSGNDVILIMMGDEKSTVPEDLCDHFFAIMKPFHPLEECRRNILPLPVGYSNSAAMTRFIPFAERKYDASYAGNFLANRLDFYRQFNLLRYLPPWPVHDRRLRNLYQKALIKTRLFRPTSYHDTFGHSLCYWSDGFAKGLPREEYAEIISQTRIALCPKGFLTTECFRLMETMRLGCVIIADELPPSRWYKNSPIIIVKDWLHIRRVMDDLLRDPERLLEIHQQTLAWWNDICSDEATARYLAGEIRHLIKKSVN